MSIEVDIAQPCAICRHPAGWHSAELTIIKPEYIDENRRTYGCTWCRDSHEFVPSDNLDYVEWLAKKKHLV